MTVDTSGKNSKYLLDTFRLRLRITPESYAPVAALRAKYDANYSRRPVTSLPLLASQGYIDESTNASKLKQALTSIARKHNPLRIPLTRMEPFLVVDTNKWGVQYVAQGQHMKEVRRLRRLFWTSTPDLMMVKRESTTPFISGAHGGKESKTRLRQISRRPASFRLTSDYATREEADSMIAEIVAPKSHDDPITLVADAFMLYKLPASEQGEMSYLHEVEDEIFPFEGTTDDLLKSSD